MKGSAIILILLLYTFTCLGQQVNTSQIHPLFTGERINGDKVREKFDNFEPVFITGKPKGPNNDIVLSMFHSRKLYLNSSLYPNEKLPELEHFKLKLKPGKGYATLVGRGNSLKYAVPLFDSLPVIVTAYGINPTNKEQFRYRVLKNEREELVGWTIPQLFSPAMMMFRYNVDGTEQTKMAYLGSFCVPVGNSITVEVKDLAVRDTVYKISAVWIRRAPEVVGVYSGANLKELISVFKYQWKNDQGISSSWEYYGNYPLKPVDSMLRLYTIFKHNDNNIFFYLRDKVQSAEFVEYQLIKGADSTEWKANTLDPNIILLKNLNPGDYTLLLRYSFQREAVSSYHFTLLSAWYQATWFKFTSLLICIVALLSVYLIIKNRFQRRRLKMQETEQAIMHAEIRSLKSQFNPHFVFNALSSIQGLITKGDTDAANIYLNDFSTLLRTSLKESQNEFISLSKDLLLVFNYLKLEQLRFNFKYEIFLDPTINKHEVEVPVLLLQPVIENAIKHGVSVLYENGEIIVSYERQNDDLVITVSDNGEGITTVNTTGHGLKLTNERVKLLNRVMKDSPISWEVKRTGGLTLVIFKFKHWLA